MTGFRVTELPSTLNHRQGCLIGPGEKRRELAQAINVCRLFHNQPKCVLATAVALGAEIPASLKSFPISPPAWYN